ncbi:MAG: cupin domain-containing protein [Patescibacteria group bacterium]
MTYLANIAQLTAENDAFRTVLHTTTKSQLVVMTIPIGGDIGMETHAHVEQIFFIQSGSGKTIIDDIESPISAGFVVIVPPGTKHNILNTGNDPLRIATVYVPPNHRDGTVHHTKADAEADRADEAFGATV